MIIGKQGKRNYSLAPPNVLNASGLLSVVVVHDHVNKGIVEACDPAHNDALVDGVPTHGQHDGMVVHMQEGQGALAQYQEYSVNELVVFGKIEEIGPPQEAVIFAFVVAASTVNIVELSAAIKVDIVHSVHEPTYKNERKCTQDEVVDDQRQAQDLIEMSLGFVLHPFFKNPQNGQICTGSSKRPHDRFIRGLFHHSLVRPVNCID